MGRVQRKLVIDMAVDAPIVKISENITWSYLPPKVNYRCTQTRNYLYQ